MQVEVRQVTWQDKFQVMSQHLTCILPCDLHPDLHLDLTCRKFESHYEFDLQEFVIEN